MQPSNLQLLKALRGGLAQLKQDATGAAALIAHMDIAVGELLARTDGRRFAQADNPELEYLQLGLPIRALFAKEMLQDCAPIWKAQGKPAPKTMTATKPRH